MELGSVINSVAKQSVENFRSALLSTSALSPISNFVQQSVLSSLNKIKRGSLTIVLPNGDNRVFGEVGSDLSATITVQNGNFWMRIFLSADLVSISSEDEIIYSKITL